MPLQVNDIGNFECSRTFFPKKKKSCFLAVHNTILEFRGVASFARSGGGGQNLNQGGKGFCQNPKAFSGRNHKFSAQKQVISKKKSSPKSEGIFWPKSQILTFFPPKNNNFFLPKKFCGGQEKSRRGAKTKIGGALPPCPPAGDAPVGVPCCYCITELIITCQCIDSLLVDWRLETESFVLFFFTVHLCCEYVYSVTFFHGLFALQVCPNGSNNSVK